VKGFPAYNCVREGRLGRGERGGGDARNLKLQPVEGQAPKASNKQASSSTLLSLVCFPMAVNQVSSLTSAVCMYPNAVKAGCQAGPEQCCHPSLCPNFCKGFNSSGVSSACKECMAAQNFLLFDLQCWRQKHRFQVSRSPNA
jgi:hypothetical protein